MFKTAFNEKDLQTAEGNPLPVALIQDWYDLAPHLNLQPYQLSHAKRNKDDLQKKIVLKKGNETRVVYKSVGPLQSIQNRLRAFLCSMENDYLGKEAIAYRKGLNPLIDVVSELTNSRYLVTFDIVKYYDHVTFKHIKNTLMEMGFPRLGSQLISNYSTVKRTIGKSRRPISTLQQGSKVSPILSNLVGNKYIDRVVQAWISTAKNKYPGITMSFLRYSDNIALSIDAPGNVAIPIELIQEFKQHIKEELFKSGFRTHKWASIPNTHPKRNQQFLGVVLNKKARIDNVKFDKWRATLFNACRCGLTAAAKNYYENCTTEKAIDHRDVESQRELFMMVMKGRISYLKNVSIVQSTQLQKLLVAAEFLRTSGMYKSVIAAPAPGDNEVERRNWVGMHTLPTGDTEELRITDPGTIAAIKTYKRKGEEVDVYLERVKESCAQWISAQLLE